MRRLLIGDSGSSWREWIRSQGEHGELLILDPLEATFGPPARLSLQHAGRIIWERFYGSLDPQRSPHVLIATLAETLSRSEKPLEVLLFAYRPVPILRHTVALIAQLLKPTEIYVSSRCEIDLDRFPVGPSVVELPEAFPAMVRQAQRKAHWLKVLENCTDQKVSLDQVSVEGSRLGTGIRLSREDLSRFGLNDALYAERAGANLFVVSDADLEESTLARALDITGASKAIVTSPSKFTNVHCSFARESGEDIGFGFVRALDWESRMMTCACTAVPPAPLKILRLGSLRVDSAGNEVGELRPWEI